MSIQQPVPVFKLMMVVIESPPLTTRPGLPTTYLILCHCTAPFQEFTFLSNVPSVVSGIQTQYKQFGGDRADHRTLHPNPICVFSKQISFAFV